MKSLIKSSSLIFRLLMSVVALAGCGSNDPGLCVDGTNNHELQYHEKEEFDEKEGHEAYYSCSKCNKCFDENKKFIEMVSKLKPKRKIILSNKFEGKSINPIDSVVDQYLSLNEEAKQAEFLFNNQSYRSADSKPILFSWTRNECSFSLTLEISKDENFSVIERTITNLSNDSISIYNIKPGLHYYRLKDVENNYSLVDSFNISHPLYSIHSNVKNMRDLGGWETNSGDKIKYGYLYRSALPSSEDASIFYWDLKIKTEMDLRIKGGQVDEIGDFKGVLPGMINYVHPVEENVQYWPQYDLIFDSNNKESTKDYFKNVFNVLSNEENYPVVFHCTHGADRTGTLAYIINGLAGVDYKNLVKDYELTSLFYSPRWRSDIIKDGNSYSFDPSGCMKETGRFNLFHNKMMSTYGQNKTISQAILSFLTDYCEIDVNLIKQTLSIIIDGNNFLNLFE